MTAATQPTVWGLLADRRGDNAQVLALAEALPWPFEVKYVGDRPTPPWPDLVLTIGRRPGEIAARIQAASGGLTRLVQIGPGDTRLGLAGFDLLISNPQSRLPPRPNVVQLELPFVFPDERRLADAAALWQPRFAPLPRPWTAVFIGGATPPLSLDPAIATGLLADVARPACAGGGSLLVTTSPRTPAAVAAALEAALPANAFLNVWSPDAADSAYPAMLALADRFVVTADSVSMQTEVIRLGKPLAIYPLPADGRAWARRTRHLARSLFFPLRARPIRRRPVDINERLADGLTRLGLRQHRRAFGRFHADVFRQGLAVPFGQPFPGPRPPPADERPIVVRRIMDLFLRSSA